MKRFLKILLCVLLTIVCAAGVAFLILAYTIMADILTDLSALNLPKVYAYKGYYMQSGDGFYAFVMPRYKSHENPGDLRADAMEAIASAKGWHTEPVTAAEFEALLQACQVSIPLHPAEDAVYDAWFFRHEKQYPDALPMQRPAGQWTLCLFDRDVGNFITLTQADPTQDADALAPSLSALGLTGLEGQLGSLPVLREETPLSLTAFEVPAALRGTVRAMIESSGVWQECSISSSDAAFLLESLQEEVFPHLYPAAEASFDWRFQQGTLCALYDADTGLFIYYEWDS